MELGVCGLRFRGVCGFIFAGVDLSGEASRFFSIGGERTVDGACSPLDSST